MINVGVIGATGYAGKQLVSLLIQHKNVEIKFLSSNTYEKIKFSNVYPEYFKHIENKCINIQDAIENLSKINVLFIALPHGKSFHITKKALSLGVKIIDLGADFRIKDRSIYEKWYKVTHEADDILKTAVYGLPEINRTKVKEATLIGNPGCFPTASILALAPLLKNKIIDKSSIIIDAKSGVSGAGRSLSTQNLFAECNESIKAYNIGFHRHTPEIEQELSTVYGDNIILSFTPHLVPMSRGILSTCYGTLIKDLTKENIYKTYEDFYKGEKFIRIREELPETKWVKGTNFCDIAIRTDERTKRVIIISAIDNLMKGAASQGIQNMNLMFNINESEGLEFISMIP